MSAHPLRAQSRTEVVLTLRRGESVLLTLGIPVALLVFFSIADVFPTPDRFDHAVDFLFPGVLALAVMSAAMVGPAIATGFEREYGVLKRLAVTPLGRPSLIAAKTAGILVVEVVQVGILTVVAVLLGWGSTGTRPLVALGAVLLGTIAFAGLGLLLGGTLPGLTTLAAANGLYVLLLLVGGMLFPLSSLPGWLQGASRALPPASLADLLHGALEPHGHAPLRAWLVLGAWAVAGPALASRWFRWT
ncbi:MAG: type transport system permease protein [Actinomycetota bacterium]|jgi:ABC-2 type transport system permease protein|nr:type transport system permease protein [Actinomycetota bacterium]